jgi:signal transduction histidine kinase
MYKDNVSSSNNESALAELQELFHIITHEIAHIVLELQRPINEISRNSKLEKTLSDEKMNNIITDINAGLFRLTSLNSDIRVIINKTAEKETLSFDGLCSIRTLIVKLQNFFIHLLREKNLDIVLNDSITQEPKSSHENKTDCIEQLLRNLVEYTIHQSYWGSNILIDVDRHPSDNHLRFSVIYYGDEINNDDHLYQLFSRVRRSGIELYVVKTLLHHYNGQIHHSCTFVSDYYVPFINLYLARQLDSRNNQKLSNRLKTEIMRLTNLKIYDRIISNSPFPNTVRMLDQPDLMLIDKINTPTYEVAFEVIL